MKNMIQEDLKQLPGAAKQMGSHPCAVLEKGETNQHSSTPSTQTRDETDNYSHKGETRGEAESPAG